MHFDCEHLIVASELCSGPRHAAQNRHIDSLIHVLCRPVIRCMLSLCVEWVISFVYTLLWLKIAGDDIDIGDAA